MFQHIVIHHLTFHFLKFMRMIMIAKPQALLVAALTYFIVISTISFQILQCFRNIHPGSYDIFHSCCLMVGDTLIPPFKWFWIITGSQFLFRQSTCAMRRQNFHSGRFDILLELSGSSIIKFSIIIISRFNTGISHFCQFRENGSISRITFSVLIVYPIQYISNRIELNSHFFLSFFSLCRHCNRNHQKSS